MAVTAFRILATVAVALTLVACAQVQPREAMTTTDMLYDEPVETLADLRATSDAVVVARPLPGGESVLLDVDGVQVLGRRFRVVRSLRGPLPAGSAITVARPRYGVSPDTERRLNAQGYTVIAVPDEQTDDPPFDRPLYLLGLDSTGADYPVAAWTPANGPHSRVAFDTAALRGATATVEVAGTPLQERLAGRRAGDIIRRLGRR